MGKWHEIFHSGTLIMDIATLLGLAIGISVIVLAILTGSDFYVFLNASGFLIVACGTFAATLIKFPLKKSVRRLQDWPKGRLHFGEGNSP